MFKNDGAVQISLTDPDKGGANDSGVYTWESYYYNVICGALKRCCKSAYTKSQVPVCLTIRCCINKEMCSSYISTRDILTNCGCEFMYNYTDVITVNGKHYHFNDLIDIVPE